MKHWVHWMLVLAATCVAYRLSAAAGPTDAQRCEAVQLRAVGNNFACIMREQSRAVLARRAPDISKCVERLSLVWSKAEVHACPNPVWGGGTNRFVDNGNGTMTDRLTRLVWERKDDNGGLHDKDNTYTWDDANTTWIMAVNAEGGVGYAGRDDWRVPTLAELQSILAEPNLCSVSPCVDPVFNNGNGNFTASSYYWSSTELGDDPLGVWVVGFSYGLVGAAYKTGEYHARAVRGGR